MKIAFLLLIPYLIFLCFTAFAHEGEETKQENQPQKGEQIEHRGDPEVITVIGRRLKYLEKRRTDDKNVYKTEILRGDTLDRFGAQTLADAIPQASGVDTQVFCANCGAKRVTINGLRGEHTTILIDGFPMHSTVSSFYGIDAVPINGIQEIQVKRGAGSSLIAPESIGGTLDLISINPTKNKFSLFNEGGSHGDYQSSVLATAVSENSRVLFTGQLGAKQPWDLDNNNIAESPYRNTQSASVKLIQDLNDSNTVSLRYSHADLLIIGGNAKRHNPHDYTRAQADGADFINSDVRNEYIGELNKITDVIDLGRNELALQYDLYLSAEDSLQFRSSLTTQKMDALYSHGFDYRNTDEISFYDLRYQGFHGDSHILTFGIDTKLQRMRSKSDALYITRDPPLLPDSLNFQSQAFYAMDEWDVTEKIEIDTALRIDHLAVRWLDLGQKIDQVVIAPRIQSKYKHSDHISSRLSYGLGYRPPLTLFESEHGSNHDGFVVEIDEFEKAHSLVYGLDFNYPRWFAAFSGHYTTLQNMAYAEDRIDRGEPMLFKNTDEVYQIFVADIFIGGKPTENTDVQFSYEKFIYGDSYAEKLPTAAIEDRCRVDFEYKYLSPTSLNLQATYVGPRDLARYGYDEHYNRYDTDVTSDNFGNVSDQKKTRVPGFWQIDASHKYSISKNYALTFRVNNLLDYTQTTDADDSPTTWHWHVNHAHYDNFHTWGPLTGRQYFVGVEGNW